MLKPHPAITRIDGRGPRHYQVEGFESPFPSVTTVLGIIAKPALIPWARNRALDSVHASLSERVGGITTITPEWIGSVIAEARRRPDEERDKAANFGTQAHLLIDGIIQGGDPDIPPEMEPVVGSFLQWRHGSRLDILLSEQMVFSADHHYAGAMDAVAYRDDGALCALDWKTSNGLYPENSLQVAAYAKALGEMTGEQVAEAWIVRLGKNAPEFEARQVVDIDASFDAFLAALSLWRSMRTIRL
jgi:hypothetical protein